MAESTGPRGPYRKGLQRRREIVAAAAELFAESGYAHSSMRELARRMRLTQTGLLHHFADKEELLVEVLNLRDSSVADYLSEQHATDVATRSREVARHSAEHEGLTSLYIILSAEAIDRDHPAHPYFVEHYQAAQTLTLDPGPEAPEGAPMGISPEMIATLGTALQDGLQIQRRYRDDLDVVEAIDAFWRLVAAARAHWVQQAASDDSNRRDDDSD
ncbi:MULTISPECIES: TetR/AcrR family transcriptional regulator [Streptomyces]|uniref:Helix-turn-helix domain containing protein n=8 Tax=Streptomyces TaxID=1883 RepID=A0AAP6EJ20_9ACTN|nr:MULTISPECIES: TetR/AcrR family transcriptional regulator [Streptomyces]MBP5865079.1 TetR/AcrR family transcriptional regulator [Streptomyces sp. LBUM 1484]MBP5904698.1 TetR/AcrR family transcriptional regulator [Streptomyces sp. LBUM 1478]MBP5933131.1 TetR/AcrR family transcriptional regulator [Streptomyces sp. LBUM 1479]MBP5940989.1 TetR/AcrR family transcriptional regulator [Streptomyces sp. LBUM 1476]ELP66209.1 transcriptional regulator, TetR family [Streptomyces turgidiscabies Car8]